MQQQQAEQVLKNFSDLEKGAYLGAIASLATADHVATEEEEEHIRDLADSAGLSEGQKQAVVRAAKELSGEELKRCLDVLKESDLRFSLVSELIRFAESDGNYTPEEKANIEKIAQYLNINQQQFSLLDQFVQKTNEQQPTVEQVQQPGFLSSLGLEDKFKKAGINSETLKGILSVAGPMLLAGLVSRGLGGGRRRGGFSPLGRGGYGRGGGLGSLISSLSGGRGYSPAGGLLGRILRF